MIEDLDETSRYKIPKKKTLSELIKSSVISLITVLTILLVSVVSLFLINMSAESQKGYMLKQIYLYKSELEEKNKELNSMLVEAMSYKEISNKDILSRMEDVGNPIYLKNNTFTSKK